jgi:hypothetical protein
LKEKPILFSAPMVRAILAGTKTQTRRAVKGWPLEWLSPPISFSPEYVANPENHACPYGQPGDKLWVREAWRVPVHVRIGKVALSFEAGDGPERADHLPPNATVEIFTDAMKPERLIVARV